MKVPFIFCLLFALFAALNYDPLYADDFMPEEPSKNPLQTRPAIFFPEDFPELDAGQFEILEEILSSRDFGGTKDGWGLRLRKKNNNQYSNYVPENIGELLGYFLRAFVILVVAAFIGFAVYWFIKNRRWFYRLASHKGEIYSNPAFPGENPESLFEKAEEHYLCGDLFKAWAACLSGYIGAYSRYRLISFPGNATEYDCLTLVQKCLPGESSNFGEMIKWWVLFAYAGRPPENGAFEKAIAGGRCLLGISENGGSAIEPR